MTPAPPCTENDRARARVLWTIVLLFVWAALATAPAAAQERPLERPAEPSNVETVRGEELPDLALGTIEFVTGFPGYNRFSVRGSFQQDAFGVALTAAYTEAGLYGSVAGRAYLPIPVPVPTYVTAGAGFLGRNPTFHAAFGAHVPLGASNFRLTVEAGVARAVVLNEARFLPHVTAGVGYTFAFDPAPRGGGIAAAATAAGAQAVCTAPREPDEASLRTAFGREVRQNLAELRVTYAGTYRDLQYEYDVTSVSIAGRSGSVSASYRGSVQPVIGGGRESASGTIQASFDWNGCAWTLRSYRY